jgi:competence protein ComGC
MTQTIKKQSGSTLVVALVILTIITMVSIYSLEGTNLQSKMIANSFFTSIAYQECRNEQESNIRFYNLNGGVRRTDLIDIRSSGTLSSTTPSITLTDLVHPPKSEAITMDWTYLREAPASRAGYDLDVESPTVAYLFENDCTSTYRFANNSQTLGITVESLKQAGNFD